MFKRRLLNRKNFLPTLIIDLVLWMVWGGIVWWTSPETWWAVTGFFVSGFMAAGILAALLSANTRRGLLISTAITGYGLMRFFGLDSWVNVGLAASLLILIEVWYAVK